MNVILLKQAAANRPEQSTFPLWLYVADWTELDLETETELQVSTAPVHDGNTTDATKALY